MRELGGGEDRLGGGHHEGFLQTSGTSLRGGASVRPKEGERADSEA